MTPGTSAKRKIMCVANVSLVAWPQAEGRILIQFSCGINLSTVKPSKYQHSTEVLKESMKMTSKGATRYSAHHSLRPISFYCTAPDARSVSISGDFNRW